MLDSFLMLSDNQHCSHATAGAQKDILSDKYIDLGAFSSDQWGSGSTTRPGWWIPEQLVLVWTLGTAPVTDTGIGDSNIKYVLYGTNDLSQIKTEPTGANSYWYFISGECRAGWPKAYPGAEILQVGLPRVFHRYLFIVYEVSGIYYANFNTWIGFGNQFVLPTFHPDYHN